ncbi:MAG: phosphoglycerate dehydrogenase [Hydrogenophaga sp.]|uniref:phosphoglycerate dehydrogenase n=1 Tax=Hydrogenophaga sp. TaxID=1904254 RepID=UPI0027359F56|nr:phosphoglycerate dehydrogenase [Hydrogenophaga sp.]MDP3626617.1 phosphoglycerate dehydrogenase [Hydrogenophaga sp.]
MNLTLPLSRPEAAATSIDKRKIRFLLLEGIDPSAIATLQAAGYSQIESLAGSPSDDELRQKIADVHFVGIRSRTQLTAEVLAHATRLIAIGCFCIGTNQVDLSGASERGIGVFNAPYSNTRSVVELVIGEIIALARRLPEKTQRMHDGVWDKSAAGSHEIRGRTLGIVGYGNIGTQLSNVAEAIGMSVVFFDTSDRPAHGNARRMRSLDELLAISDVVTLHVDGRPGNAGFFGAAEFARMKPRSMFINASRGMVVDYDSLREHLLTGHISGAAVDVFPVEPKVNGDTFESVLRGLANVILTPHVGGSTQEAQGEIGWFVGNKLAGFALEGSTALSVNLPIVATPPLATGHRLGFLHRNVPGVLAEFNALFAGEGNNVVSQRLSTRDDLGYVVTDVSAPLPEDALQQLRSSEHCLWARTW